MILVKWQNKVSATEFFWAYAIYEIQKEETGLFEDAALIAGTSWATLGLWAPEARTAFKVGATTAIAPYAAAGAAALVVPVAVGGVAALAVGGEEGLVDYVDFMEDVITADTGELVEKVEFTGEALHDYGKKVESGLSVVTNYVERKGKEALAWLDNRLPKVRWSNPLPFRF